MGSLLWARVLHGRRSLGPEVVPSKDVITLSLLTEFGSAAPNRSAVDLSVEAPEQAPERVDAVHVQRSSSMGARRGLSERSPTHARRRHRQPRCRRGASPAMVCFSLPAESFASSCALVQVA